MHRSAALPGLLVCATLLHGSAAYAADEGPTADLPAIADDMVRQAEVIKTIQDKNFLKVKRFEFSLFAGGVTNDAFLRRWLTGASGTYHLTEIVALEGAYSFSPDLGTADNRQLTNELQTTYAAAPIISKVRHQASVDLLFSPLYGKFALNRTNIVNFDIYLAAGAGASRTQDESGYTCDGVPTDPTGTSDPLTDLELAALCEWHFTTNYGFGFRGAFNEWMAVRVDGRSYMYIEHVAKDAEESLEMKSNFIAQLGLSFFFPTTWK